MAWTYPFGRFGRGVSIHYSVDIRRSVSNRICIGDSVYIARDTWLNVPEPGADDPPSILLEDGCRIGRRCMISAKNLVRIGTDVILGPSVLIADHSHEFSNMDLPIHAQGLTAGGTVLIERNCWVGYGAAIICTSGNLSIGRNSVIGANSVVTHSVPQFSVVVGNPAKIVRQYDSESRDWARPETYLDAERGELPI
jgi:carbonic anhydrase/acetyltransferase-like protein (isoleucine patch superfamily)